MLLKHKVFIPSLQTADRSSDSPACLAVSCFKAIWTLGLCGQSEGSNSRAVMQTGVTAFTQLPLLSTCKAVDKVLLCWYCVILNLSLAWKGSNSICFSDTSAGSLGTSLLFFGREHCNPVTLSTESKSSSSHASPVIIKLELRDWVAVYLSRCMRHITSQ